MALSSPRARAGAPLASSPQGAAAAATSPAASQPRRRCRAAAAAALAPLPATPARLALLRPPSLRSLGASSSSSPGRLSPAACRAIFFAGGSGSSQDPAPEGRSSSSAAAAPPTTTTPPQASTQTTLGPDDLPPADAPEAYASAEAADRLWRQLADARRALADAVAREDFGAAAGLRDEARALAAALPPVRQYVLHQLERLRTGRPPAGDGDGDGGGGEGRPGGLESGESGGGADRQRDNSSGLAVPVGGGGGGASSPDGRSNNGSSSRSAKRNTSSGPTRGIRAERHPSSSSTTSGAAAGGRSSSAEEDALTGDGRGSNAAAAGTTIVAERLSAIAALAEVGDAAVLPDLARALKDPSLQAAAQHAMWAVFGRCGVGADPRVAEAMEEGGKLLGAGAGGPGGTNPSLEAALACYDRVVAVAPDFAEAHNKRATVLYLLGRHAQAVDACEACLAINPWHFGAASGCGLCHVALQRPADALRAFERALDIHPGLTQIARYAAALRLTLEEGGGGREEGDV
jgi:tetratricopeptide (TPR) repeat protein